MFYLPTCALIVTAVDGFQSPQQFPTPRPLRHLPETYFRDESGPRRCSQCNTTSTPGKRCRLRAAGLFSAVYHASATPQPHRPAEWRRGPDGRNTLCNGIALFAFVWRRGCDVLTACGLKFARTYLKKALNKPASGIRKRRSDDEETTIGMASPLQENLAQTFPPVVQPVRSLLPQLIIRCLTLTPGDSPSSCLPMT